MNIERVISTVDLHTAVEPVRLILRGVPLIPGKTMKEKQKFFSEKLDVFRTIAMHEPRGHRDMCGCIITSPTSRKAHFGLIFFDGEETQGFGLWIGQLLQSGLPPFFYF